MISENVLLIFARNAVLGKVKTRLAATIGAQRALEVYRQLLVHTHTVSLLVPVDKIIYHDGDIEGDNLWPVDFLKEKQCGSGLGERMQEAFATCFKKGYKKVVIIGTDCPGISAPIIEDAFARLDKSDVVIGPALDGGYYLLGATALYPELFSNIPWSSNEVYPATLQACMVLGLQYYSLPPLSDVDEEADLVHMKHMAR